MLNVVEVFDVMQLDAISGDAVWIGQTGTRAALMRDGFVIDPKAMAYCRREWLNDRGYLEVELARKHHRRVGHLTMIREQFIVGRRPL